MDYRKFGECYYIRMDRNDETVSYTHLTLPTKA